MIKIVAFTSNRPDLIELQARSFKKYIQEDYTFTIFNNSKFDRMAEYHNINNTCQRWGIQVFDIEKDPDLIARCNAVERSCTVFNSAGVWSNPNCAGCYGCCYVWEKWIIKQDGPVCLLHPDLFFDRPIKLTDHLQKSPLAFIPQSRPGLGGIHMHDALVLVDVPKLPDAGTINWWGSYVNNIGTDIGGQTFFYLQAHPNLNPTLIEQWLKPDDPDVDFHPAEYEIIGIDGNPIGIHYLRGSNWNYRPWDYHEKKTAWITKRLLG